MLYFSVKTFFHSILSIFFRRVEIIGRENIPRHGPVLFTINHANQFMDAVTVLCTCQHNISYLMAESSWKRRIIGDIAWALDVVPVKRAQDDAKPGLGQLFYETTADNATEMKVTGTDTRFTEQLAVGDKVRPKGTAMGLKIKRIENNVCLWVDVSSGLPDDFPFPTASVTYDHLKHTPLNVVFNKVLEKLATGGTVGVFPEGGSHDRTDLLPLKVGLALIAYSALEQDGLNIPIVPVGLNYFRAHRWRGRAVVEYGRPIYIDPSTLDDFKAGGKEVCSNVLF
jgi:glycerol-3-phosphate O-acyltransferase/dihydroxyacetone phosphate acyltransferase